MKVVLFCGGQGLRLRDVSENTPKPMVPIGYRPIIWHLMKYYAHFGHKEFILCLGHRADVIKDYFLRYDEATSNDFVLRGSQGERRVEMLARDMDDWSITFVDTGVDTNVGERLWAVRDRLKDEDMFLANYADNLSDLHLPTMLDHFRNQNVVASCLTVKPSQSFHYVEVDGDSRVTGIVPASNSSHWINGGFLAFRRDIFDFMRPQEDLVPGLFPRLIEQRQLATFRYEGFWHAMDTFKEKQTLEDLHARGKAPWQVWKKG